VRRSEERENVHGCQSAPRIGRRQRWEQSSQMKKTPLAARDQLESRRRLSEHETLNSHHHILPWLRFSRALNVVTPEAGCSAIGDEEASEETLILRRWRP
jgi:hypothetical protein